MYEVDKESANLGNLDISGFLMQMMNIFNSMDSRNLDILLALYSLVDDDGIVNVEIYQECKDLFGYDPDEIIRALIQEKNIYSQTDYREPSLWGKTLLHQYLTNKISLEEMYDSLLAHNPGQNLHWEAILLLSMFFDTDTKTYRKKVIQNLYDFFEA